MRKCSIILAAGLLLTATACGQTESAVDAQTAETTASVNTAAAETELARETCGVTDALDFEGKPFRMAAFDWQGYNYYFFAEEENGDVMNDAIYRRMQKVEETIHVDVQTDIRSENCDQFAASMKKLIMAGDDSYDQIFLHCISGISALSSAGYLYNLDTLPHLDITAAWWNQEQMDVLRLGKNTYYAVNDFMIPCPYVMFFSKDIIRNENFDNPYQLVYDGKWTLDRFSEMAKTMSADLDSNGKWDFSDQYGVTAFDASTYISFAPGAGQFMTKRGQDGKIQLAMNTEKMVSIVDRFQELAKENVFYIPASGDIKDQISFDTGRILFVLGAIADAERMRDYESDFGFLPYPKYDESQERYYSMDWGGLTAVPSTIRNPELVGAAMELFAYESAEEVIPTYYDTVLTGRLARDPDAVKMMDLLFDTICYEIGGNYFGFSGGFRDLFFAIPELTVSSRRGDFASFYAKKEKSTLRTIQNFYENLDLVENQS